MKTLIKMSAVALVLALSPVAFISSAVAGPTYTGLEGNIAVGGYDVVSYFSASGTPQKGSSAHRVTHRGAVYHFATSANADKFKADPDAFAPAYGGHCAWAMARGSLAPGDPTKYKVVAGKLYLNFNQQVQEFWKKDIAGFISQAESQWPKIPDSAKFGE